MNHSEYLNLMKEYASKVKLISHTTENPKVVTVDEVLEKKRNLKYKTSPGLLISSEEGRMLAPNIDSVRESTFYTYSVIQYWENNNFDQLNQIYDATKKAGLLIFKLMLQDKLNRRKELIGLEDESFAFEKAKYVSDNAFGYEFSFEIHEGFSRVIDPEELN